jgi:hypothetical protein
MELQVPMVRMMIGQIKILRLDVFLDSPPFIRHKKNPYWTILKVALIKSEIEDVDRDLHQPQISGETDVVSGGELPVFMCPQ